MNILGIVAEYNPFHNGHLYHLRRSKELTDADITVAVMSGDFVQRGEPAAMDKWFRSEMAVRNGVDLVLELPFAYACNNAEIFAKGSIEILEGLGCIDAISFGSESGNIKDLFETAYILAYEPDDFSSMLKGKMKEGLSFPKARQDAVAALIGEEKAACLDSPNNILGVEYLKQLILQNSAIKPYTLKRSGASPDEVNDDLMIAGATAIRKMIDVGMESDILKYLPMESRNMIERCKVSFADFEMFRDIVIYSIISKSESDISNIYSVTEGLENKIYGASVESVSIRDLISRIKSKRYTETRIKRILVHILTGLDRKNMLRILEKRQLYTRVLAFNNKGASLLKKIKDTQCATFPLITNISKESDMLECCPQLFHYDILTSNIFNLAVTGDIYNNSDYRRIPAYIR